MVFSTTLSVLEDLFVRGTVTFFTLNYSGFSHSGLVKSLNFGQKHCLYFWTLMSDAIGL